MKTRLLDEFRIGPKDVHFTFNGTEHTVWVRRPNNPEKQLCETKARVASREFRKLLENPKTEEHRMFVAEELATYSRDELEMIWMASEIYKRLFEFERQTLEDRDQTFIPEPTTEDGIHYPSQSDIDKYEDAVEQAEEDREAAVKQKHEAIVEQLKEEAGAMDLKKLRKNAIPRRIDQLCGQAYNEAYATALVCRCTFEDEEMKRPMFKTDDETRTFFRDYPEIAMHISQEHQSLMANVEEVKN